MAEGSVMTAEHACAADKARPLTVIRHGRIVDPSVHRDEAGELWIKDGNILDQEPPLSGVEPVVIDATNQIVLPGLIDMHVHLSEPGYEYRETIQTGAMAAAAGGCTAIACMPDTNPVLDNAQTVRFVKTQATDAAVRVYPIGAITTGRQGEQLTEIGHLVDAGVVGISDAGRPIENPAVLRRALEYARMFDPPVMVHCEDLRLSANGMMNEGRVSTRLGLKGIPVISEETIVARDIKLAEWTGGRIHITHVSAAGSVALIRAAKARGVRVTSAVTPHHLVLTDDALAGYDTNLKVHPPLRAASDVEALRTGLLDGTIDVIASDHTPCSIDEKNTAYQEALFGAIGLETMLAVIMTELIIPGYISLSDAIRTMTVAPAQILGISGGTLQPGTPADITIMNPDKSWLVTPDVLHSKSHNTPFGGLTLNGAVTHTIVGGKVLAWEDHDKTT
jgi:dihydroorotase